MVDMRDVVIDKVTINIGVGESGEKLEKAKSVIKLLTSGNPTITKARRTSREFGIRQDQPIGVKVTLKGEEMDRLPESSTLGKKQQVPQLLIL
ncbi:MAG: hypothetical protein AMDU3_IPLC00004G0318 [Thermoplasmatales archaeon I-plasma]|nr:MAG: hypothetical protein AMDU3_IPLC00004G0318 [Thermoplasmatales archaeon I-plasma]